MKLKNLLSELVDINRENEKLMIHCTIGNAF